MNVTYGALGSVSYLITDVASGATVLNYTATGWMGDQASLKYGTYRAAYVGMPALTNYVG